MDRRIYSQSQSVRSNRIRQFFVCFVCLHPPTTRLAIYECPNLHILCNHCRLAMKKPPPYTCEVCGENIKFVSISSR